MGLPRRGDPHPRAALPTPPPRCSGSASRAKTEEEGAPPPSLGSPRAFPPAARRQHCPETRTDPRRHSQELRRRPVQSESGQSCLALCPPRMNQLANFRKPVCGGGGAAAGGAHRNEQRASRCSRVISCSLP